MSRGACVSEGPPEAGDRYSTEQRPGLESQPHFDRDQLPARPGHEVVGVIDAVGKDVPERWQAGQRCSRSLRQGVED
jgi:NADPH:quinone reductase-like Zn-dependent oxidoreductase